ncbi:MAG: NYN domain-containing protein [Atribacterota bacterium]|nr:NYN domain-containing protein [Atribacterota bacterium]
MSIGMFIDGAYVYKSIGDQKINYLQLREYIERELSDIVDVSYFFNADDNPPQEEKLHYALTLTPPDGPGFRTKIGWLSRKPLFWPKQYGGIAVMHPTIPDLQYQLVSQKSVDVSLIFHMIRSYSKRKWNKLVLAGGDGDFKEPIQNLVEVENVDLYIIGTNKSISSELRPYSKKIFFLDKEPIKSFVIAEKDA